MYKKVSFPKKKSKYHSEKLKLKNLTQWDIKYDKKFSLFVFYFSSIQRNCQ